MKTKIFLFLFLINYIGLSQTKEFIVLDSLSKKPIDLAQVFYPNLEIGSVSNEDGRLIIPIEENKIIVSHINYIEKEFKYSTFKNKDTLFLTPKNNQLNEVVIYNLDLKQKFTDILKNTYLKKYSTKKAIHKSTYKETFTVNDSLSRLFQVQLNWYSKNSLFKANKPMNKQNILDITAVDYSKIKKLEKDFISSNGAYIENKTFFRYAHLNYLLSILINLTNDYEILNIQKNEKTNTVSFNATLSEKGEEIFNHKNSLIVFNKDYTSIKYVKLHMIYNSGFEKDISKIHKIPYEKKTTSHTVELSFKSLKNTKYAISYFISTLKGIIKTKNYTDKVSSTQSLFISESKLGKKIKKGNVDFSKPFYENIPNTSKVNGVKILLTRKEDIFLKK